MYLSHDYYYMTISMIVDATVGDSNSWNFPTILFPRFFSEFYKHECFLCIGAGLWYGGGLLFSRQLKLLESDVPQISKEILVSCLPNIFSQISISMFMRV